jgi:hypothetical protein
VEAIDFELVSYVSTVSLPKTEIFSSEWRFHALTQNLVVQKVPRFHCAPVKSYSPPRVGVKMLGGAACQP